MRFAYWNPIGSHNELLTGRGWRVLAALLADVRSTCERYETVPVVVYIPHKMEVYGQFISDRSGRNVCKRLPQQLRSMNNTITAVRKITADLKLYLVDLTPDFRAAARAGRLLYYPFDTHWNPMGAKQAARLIATALQGIEENGIIQGSKASLASGRGG